MTSLDQTDFLQHLRVSPGFAGAQSPASVDAAGLALAVHRDPQAAEAVWHQLETQGDGTVFQTHCWCTAWLRHVGGRAGVEPVIVVGRTADGEPLFLLPLMISRRHGIRRLTWLAADLCDYNGPLLARSFSAVVTPAAFPVLWRAIRRAIAAEPGLGFDVVVLEKMMERVGDQPNPFMALSVSPNPSGAYSTALGPDWEDYYTGKRSSSTRRRDRTKLKKLAAMGEVGFVTPAADAEIVATLDTLFAQKCHSLATMGVDDIFSRPGYQDFFRDVATGPTTRAMAHVSHLDVGDTVAATNFGLMWHGRYYHILASYDHGPVSRFGPGVAHLQRLMAHAIEHGCTVFDFTIGDERYKREWSDTELTLHDHHAAGTLRGRVVVLPFMAYRWLKRLIKQTPALWAAYTRMRALVGPMKRRSVDAGPASDDDGSES